MKSIIIFLLLIVAIGVKAQTAVTVTSKALGDQIVLQPGSFEVTPIIVTLQGDTARSLSWVSNSIQRDTTQAFSVIVVVYDKKGVVLNSSNTIVPASTYAKWALFLNKIDNYILKKRLVKQ